MTDQQIAPLSMVDNDYAAMKRYFNSPDEDPEFEKKYSLKIGPNWKFTRVEELSMDLKHLADKGTEQMLTSDDIKSILASTGEAISDKAKCAILSQVSINMLNAIKRFKPLYGYDVSSEETIWSQDDKMNGCLPSFKALIINVEEIAKPEPVPRADVLRAMREGMPFEAMRALADKIEKVGVA